VSLVSETTERIEKRLRLRVITPEKHTFDGDVDMVIMETVEGQIGVLPNHTPVTTILGHGPMRIYDGEKIEILAVFGGFCEINQKGVTVLADVAERPDEIDAERARQAKERAERRIKERQLELDEKRAKLALRRAHVRLELSGVPTSHETAKK